MRLATSLVAPSQCHNAKCTTVTATILYLDKGTVAAAFKNSGFTGFGGDLWHAFNTQVLQGKLYQSILVLIIDNEINATYIVSYALIQAGIATANDEFRSRVLTMSASNDLTGLLDRLLCHGTGIDD